MFRSLRWRLGLRVAAPELESGDDEQVASFYRGRITDCSFLSDPNHYEQPRVQWILDRIRSGRLLEIGCGNGGMTKLLAPCVEHVIALDVSTPSLDAVRGLGLENVETVESLIEHYTPSGTFDWIVMSEVLEHLRSPQTAIARCLGWLAPGGKLVVTTPHGHWESNEHLQEFTLESFTALFTRAGFESLLVSYLRDRDERRRWLVAEASAAATPPAAEGFDARPAIRRQRQGK